MRNQFDIRRSGIYALAGFVIGLLLLVAIIDYQSTEAGVKFADFIMQSGDLNLYFALILIIPTVSGVLVGSGRLRVNALRRRIVDLQSERDRSIQLQAQERNKSAELRGLLDQESGFFVDNWDELVTEKDHLREEAEISAALVEVALAIGSLGGPSDVLEMLREALPVALFADDCLIFDWDEKAKAFTSGQLDHKLKAGSSTALKELLEKHEPITVEDASTGDLVPTALAEKLGLRSAILIPGMRQDDVTAIALVIYSKAAHKFTKRDIQIASGIVSQVRIVFENAHLYTETVENRDELKRLLNRLASTQEEERRRISRDLHDGVIQNLSGIIFSLNFLGNAVGSDADDAQKEIEQLEGIVNETIADLRKVIYDLRPTILDSLGLGPTLDKHLNRFAEQNGVETDFSARFEDRLPETVETGLFRLAQESLNNIKKHANATKITLDLKRHKDTVIMTIKDNGAGFDMKAAEERASQDSGFGLSGMHERVQALSGKVKITSKIGSGTQVKVTVPYESKGA